MSATDDAWENAAVTVIGRAIMISDGDGETAALRRNARDVYQYAGELLSGPLTLDELRFVAKSLRQSLRDVLEIDEG